ncbi:MAG: Gldg family protein [Gammaproteobacteria bacterium]
MLNPELTADTRVETRGGGTIAVFRHELRLLLYAPMTHVFQVAFLLALATGIFLIADFYATDEASPRLLTVFLPWVALMLVPALAMRAWTDEPGDRSLELMQTLPLRLPSLVMGKFLAGYCVLLITLAFTLPFVATLYFLGAPDTGVVAAAYFAAALLLGACHAIALFAASLARDEVSSFIAGVILLFLLTLSGWDTFARLLGERTPALLLDVMAGASPKIWLESLGSGRISAAAVAYFVLTTFAALGMTAKVMRARRQPTALASTLFRHTVTAMCVFVILVAGVMALARLPFTLDWTAEREFTLSAGTKKVLAQLPDDVDIAFYWSATQAEVPAAIRSHSRRVRDLLETMRTQSGGKISVTDIDPLPDTDEELTALRDGLQRVPMSSGGSFYLGATFRHGERLGVIPYFDIRKDRQAEYDITVVLNGLARTATPRIGILSPLLPATSTGEGREGLSFVSELKRAYDVAVIPFFGDDLPDELDALVLIDATVLKEKMLYAIDQFVMGGGNLVVLLDPYLRLHEASNLTSPSPSEEINDITDLLLRYGVRYAGGKVVGDPNLGTPVSDERGGTLSYPYWLRVTQASPGHVVTASLNELLFIEPGELILKDDASALALVTTSEQSGALPRDDIAGKSPPELALSFTREKKRRIIAAALPGPFKSAFSKPPQAEAQHRAQAVREGVVFVVADIDWVFDPFALQTIEAGGEVVARPLNDNHALLLNMIEYASGNPALIEIRSRGRLQRAFTRIADRFRNVEALYRDEQLALSQQVENIESRIASLTKDVEANSFEDLPDELQQAIRDARLEVLPLRKRLRDIRRRVREEVEILGRRLTLINFAAGPLLVVVFGFVVRAGRRW